MGFVLPSSGIVTSSGTGGGSTVSLPGTVQDGDIVMVALRTSTGGATAFTPPAGYTLQGSEFNEGSLAGGGGRFAVYKHTWHTGDPTSVTFTHPNTILWCCFLVRSDGSPSVVTDSQNTGASNGDPEITNSFAPTDAAHDLRIAIITIEGSFVSSLIAPAETANDNNPSGKGWNLVGSFGSNASGIVTGLIAASLVGGGTSDSGNMNWNEGVVTKSWLTRAITITDGTFAPYTGVREVDMNQSDAGIQAISLEGGSESLHKEAGRYVGGARLL